MAERRRQRAVAREARLSPESRVIADIAVIGNKPNHKVEKPIFMRLRGPKALTTKDTKEHKGEEKRRLS